MGSACRRGRFHFACGGPIRVVLLGFNADLVRHTPNPSADWCARSDEQTGRGRHACGIACLAIAIASQGRECSDANVRSAMRRRLAWRLRSIAAAVVVSVPEEMHQRACQEQQVRYRRKDVACVGHQQVHAHRRHSDGDCPPERCAHEGGSPATVRDVWSGVHSPIFPFSVVGRS